MPVSESNVPLALSPDGTKLVVSLGSFQGAQLHLRSLERTDLQPVPGTIDAFNPFFSPDGEWIGFFTTNELKRAPVSGGAVQTICRAGGLLRGGATWAPDGTIYFTPYTQPSSSAGPGSGVFRVPASGGEPAVVTSLADGEIAHRDPVLLPGGRALLFTVVYGDATTQVGASFRRTSRVVLRSLETGAQRTLIEDASSARYVSTGHVLYMKRGVSANELLAVPFDVERLEVAGAPALLSDAIDSGDGYSLRIALAGDGTLAYLPRAATDDRRSLVWVDRRGAVEPLAFGERWFETPRLSPDGSRIAALVRDRGQSDVWVQERAGALSRLTFDGVQTGLVWTPDGGAVTFSTLNGGKGVIVSQQVDGDRASRQLYAASRGVWPGSWSRDGRMLAFMEGVNNGDVNLLRDGESTPTAFVNGSATEWGARLSPDERWMAYSSNESGRWQVYAKPYPGPGERRLISNVGGSEAVWSRTGRELFYRSGTKLMAVDIQPTPAFSHAEPRLVFDGPFAAGQPGLPGYDVSLDGQRFLMVQQVGDAAALRPIHLVLNWHDELRRRTAATR
jgi:serine/threonine-protein kinase